jgi:hypothetical protein
MPGAQLLSARASVVHAELRVVLETAL